MLTLALQCYIAQQQVSRDCSATAEVGKKDVVERPTDMEAKRSVEEECYCK